MTALLGSMSEQDITVRWVTQFDAGTADAIVALINCATMDGGTLGYARPLSAPEAQGLVDDLQRRVHAGESHVLLSQVDETPAGLVVLTQSRMHNCRHRAELSKGVVDPRFRGRHLVQGALRAVIEQAATLGIEQLVLDVREGSRAHALWQRLGFATYGVLEDYARIGGVRYRGHYMVQTVAALRARLGHAERRSDRAAARAHKRPGRPREPAHEHSHDRNRTKELSDV